MDAFDTRLQARLEALESAAPVASALELRSTDRPERAPALRTFRRRPLRLAIAIGLAAALVFGVAVAVRPSATEAATRTYPLETGLTVTAQTHATWAGGVGRDQAIRSVTDFWLAKLGANAALHPTNVWQVAGTLEVKGETWSMAWSGPNAKPFDVWVVELSGTSPEGWNCSAVGVVDAGSGQILGGGLSQDVPFTADPGPSKPGD